MSEPEAAAAAAEVQVFGRIDCRGLCPSALISVAGVFSVMSQMMMFVLRVVRE